MSDESTPLPEPSEVQHNGTQGSVYFQDGQTIFIDAVAFAIATIEQVPQKGRTSRKILEMLSFWASDRVSVAPEPERVIAKKMMDSLKQQVQVYEREHWSDTRESSNE